MRLQGILAFFIIYIVWGSTFLAIRYAVETIPPFLTAATRHLIAGAILLAWAWRNGERPSKEAWRAGLVLGFLFFLVGHGTLHWAEQKIPSGVAALVIAGISPSIVASTALAIAAIGLVQRGEDRGTERAGKATHHQG